MSHFFGATARVQSLSCKERATDKMRGRRQEIPFDTSAQRPTKSLLALQNRASRRNASPTPLVTDIRTLLPGLGPSGDDRAASPHESRSFFRGPTVRARASSSAHSIRYPVIPSSANFIAELAGVAGLDGPRRSLGHQHLPVTAALLRSAATSVLCSGRPDHSLHCARSAPAARTAVHSPPP